MDTDEVILEDPTNDTANDEPGYEKIWLRGEQARVDELVSAFLSSHLLHI